MQELIVRTPLIRAREGVYLKPECLQPFGSYKIRGVAEVIRQADPLRLREGLAAASAGNMGQAVAFAARELGIPCRIYVPDSAPEVKKSAIRALGAELVELPYPQVWALVQKGSEQGRGVFIHPAFEPALLTGYGSIAREIHADLPGADAVIVPFGVGGLTLGIAQELRALGSQAMVYACEPETAAPYARSLDQGRAVSVDRVPSFVDATGTPEVLPLVYARAVGLGVRSCVVTLEGTRSAIASLLHRHKLVCEGSAATSYAAAALLKHRKVVCVLTGGNLSRQLLAEVAMESHSKNC